MSIDPNLTNVLQSLSSQLQSLGTQLQQTSEQLSTVLPVHTGKPASQDAHEEDIPKIVEEEEGWETVCDTLKAKDKDTVDAWKDELNNLLVFAGLFSAVVTAFTVESYKWLQQDSGDASNTLLERISLQLSEFKVGLAASVAVPGFVNSTAPALSSQDVTSSFSPIPIAVPVNVLWVLSLILSLISAFFAIAVQQWLRHLALPSDIPIRRAVQLRALRYNDLQTWQIPGIISVLPLLLQIAVVLFLSGLFLLLRSLNVTVTIAFGVIACVALLTFLATALAPLITIKCPYKSPLVPTVLIVLQWLSYPIALILVPFSILMEFILGLSGILLIVIPMLSVLLLTLLGGLLDSLYAIIVGLLRCLWKSVWILVILPLSCLLGLIMMPLGPRLVRSISVPLTTLMMSIADLPSVLSHLFLTLWTALWIFIAEGFVLLLKLILKTPAQLWKLLHTTSLKLWRLILQSFATLWKLPDTIIDKVSTFLIEFSSGSRFRSGVLFLVTSIPIPHQPLLRYVQSFGRHMFVDISKFWSQREYLHMIQLSDTHYLENSSLATAFLTTSSHSFTEVMSCLKVMNVQEAFNVAVQSANYNLRPLISAKLDALHEFACIPRELTLYAQNWLSLRHYHLLWRALQSFSKVSHDQLSPNHSRALNLFHTLNNHMFGSKLLHHIKPLLDVCTNQQLSNYMYPYEVVPAYLVLDAIQNNYPFDETDIIKVVNFAHKCLDFAIQHPTSDNSRAILQLCLAASASVLVILNLNSSVVAATEGIEIITLLLKSFNVKEYQLWISHFEGFFLQSANPDSYGSPDVRPALHAIFQSLIGLANKHKLLQSSNCPSIYLAHQLRSMCGSDNLKEKNNMVIACDHLDAFDELVRNYHWTYGTGTVALTRDIDGSSAALAEANDSVTSNAQLMYEMATFTSAEQQTSESSEQPASQPLTDIVTDVAYTPSQSIIQEGLAQHDSTTDSSMSLDSGSEVVLNNADSTAGHNDVEASQDGPEANTPEGSVSSAVETTEAEDVGLPLEDRSHE